MNEIERIKSEGWLSEAFWKEEVICDYLVDEKLKQVWAIELDLLKEFIRVCEENNLKWFLTSGSVLGVVRHNGFIPWDDDIDVAMPREDYEKIKSLSSEFKFPYFLQSAATDPDYGYSFIKIRNTNTSWISPKFAHKKFNQGIFLDIFPLDKTNDFDYPLQREEIYNIVMQSSSKMKEGSSYLNDKDRQQIENYSTEKAQMELFSKLEEIASRNESKNDMPYASDLVCFIDGGRDKRWPRSIHESFKAVDFYGLKCRIPVGWKLYLEMVYGNWQEFPPLEKRGVWHDRGENCNPLVPYKELIQQYVKTL